MTISTPPVPFGLTPQGFNAMRLADIKQALENAFVAQFGDINLDPQSVFGQQIGVLSKSFADIWENLEDVYLSQYPNSAYGVALDNVVGLNGITRLPATQTSVVATCSGFEATLIPQNALASIPSTNDTFYAQNGGVITQNNADVITVKVGTVTTQQYTVVLSNQTFTYAIQIITFSNSGAIFETGNVIDLVINGISQTPIPYNILGSDDTLSDIADAISNFNATLSCVATATNPNIITIVPKIGYSVNVTTPIVITGGATQASSATTYQAPSDQNAITAALTALINTNTPTWLSVDHMDGTFTITANQPSVPFVANVGLNLSISYVASPITFLSENYGVIPCPIGALTNILTPIAGWSSITNYVAGNTGRLLETDAELRIRRLNSIKLLGACTVGAIQAQLLQNVPGVTSAIVFENRTLYQNDIVITFPAPFDPSDVITFFYDPMMNVTVDATDFSGQANIMAGIVAAFELLPQVMSASYGGTGNQTLTISMNILQDLVITSVTTSVSVQTVSIQGGRPPKSFEAVVQGGSQDAIANKIWQTKPAGIETYGNVNNGAGVDIIDSQGDTQVIFYSVPTQVYIWVQCALTLYAEETFPVNGIQLVQEAIYNYGISLGVGIDVLLQRVNAQIFKVSGIASGAMTIAFTLAPNDTPSYGSSDITISDTQISVWNLAGINITVV